MPSTLKYVDPAGTRFPGVAPAAALKTVRVAVDNEHS